MMKKSPFALYSLVLTAALLAIALTACTRGEKLVISDVVGDYETSSTANEVTTEEPAITTGLVTESVITEETTTADTSQESQPARANLEETAVDSENPIVASAEALIGIPFVDGGSEPSEGFDNSGLIYYLLRKNGYITCPRQLSDQSEMGEKIGYSELQPGDLVFFSSSGNGKAEFGGVYIGAGTMIYAPMPGQSVKETLITGDYWVTNFVNGVSLS